MDEHLENPTTINLSRFGEFQKQSGWYLPCAYDLQFHPRKFGKVSRDVGREYEVVLALKRKKANARTNAKKSNNTAL